MKDNNRLRNRIVALLFAAGIGVTGVLTVINSITGEPEDSQAPVIKGSIFELPDRVDNTINEAVPARFTLVNVNGLFHRLIGRRLVNDQEADVYRMKNGQLIYGADSMEDSIEMLADNTEQFSRALRRKGVPMLYVQLPFKIENGSSQMPAGTTEYANSNANSLVAELRSRNVHVLDLRDEMEDAIEFSDSMKPGCEKYEDLFYNTDQHWTNETALWAAGRIMKELKEPDSRLKADQFDVKTYEDMFLGSFGKKTGPWYGGVDDYDLVTPSGDTDFSFTIKSRDGDIVREGSFQDSLLDQNNLKHELFGCNVYETYTGGNYAYTVAKNHKNRKGHKVLLVRDSFSCAMMPFMALSCSEITAIDIRYLQSISALEMAESGDYDAVVIAYNPTMFGENTFKFQ